MVETLLNTTVDREVEVVQTAAEGAGHLQQTAL